MALHLEMLVVSRASALISQSQPIKGRRVVVASASIGSILAMTAVKGRKRMTVLTLPVKRAIPGESIAPAEGSSHPDHERLVGRIRAEFLEMPGLCLTIAQA